MTHARIRPRPVAPAEVRARLGEPDAMIANKKQDSIDAFARLFIAHSPFLALATADATGGVDCSPRGDYPGFVKVLDDRTLAIPDRPGNKIADAFGNIAGNGGVGLLFLIPGMRETLRVNGRSYITDEPDVLARMQIEARDPILAIVVEVTEAYFHCGRALLRSRLWDPASQALAEEIPSTPKMTAQTGADIDPAVIEHAIETAYRELY